jgi:hypothetical protein
MLHPSRFLIILVFFLLVILAMFFIFHNAMKTEAVVTFDHQPSWFEKTNCLMRGGLVEDVFIGEDLDDTGNIMSVCHYK